MKVQITSDLHLDFHKDNGDSFINSMDPEDVDVLIIAGDLCECSHFNKCVTQLCYRYHNSQILYVAGNHDYYRSAPDTAQFMLQELDDNNPNFHWLENRVFELDGVKFAGTTLWFEDHPENVKYQNPMNDFHQIMLFVPWVYKQNNKAKQFLNEVAGDMDVIITHHMPSYQVVTEGYEGSYLNRFFICDMEDVIFEHEPPLWIYGHTHTPKTKVIGETQLICNPFGYPLEPNHNYKEKLIVEI